MIDYIKINNNQKIKYEKLGYWGKKTLLDCWEESVKKYGSREFVVDDRGYRYTYKEIDEKAEMVASYFIDMGIKPRDVISIQLPVWNEFIIITVACMKVGAVINPIGMCYREKEMEYILNLTECKILVCPTWYHKTDYEKLILSIKSKIGSLNHIVLIDNIKGKNSTNITLKEIFKKYTMLKNEFKGDSNDIAAILCTSGTTGIAKGVMLTHNNIIFSEKYFNRELGLGKDDIIFMPAPLNHATGFHHGIISPMLMGGKVVLQGKFDSRKAIELMNSEKCTYSMGSTPFIYDILNEIKLGKVHLDLLKFYLCGGAPVPGDMAKKAYKYGIKLCEVYGSTESVPHAFVRPDEAVELMGNVSGRAMEGVEIRIVDESRREVPEGIVGEEASRGPNVFVGYVNNKTDTDRVLDDDGWFYSGDMCVGDGKGNICIIGRKADTIVRGGENLNSNIIADYVADYPYIADEAVIGMPDERLGERICAYVVLKDKRNTVQLKELLEYMNKKKIPKRYWPERLEIVDCIPRTDSGKIKKNILKKALREKMKKEGIHCSIRSLVQEDQKKQ